MTPPTAHPCACGIVDVHTHVVPERFPRYLGSQAHAPWPSMAQAQPCHQHVMVSGKVYRTVSHQCWDPAVRLADMDRMSVEAQALSPMPELLSYWMSPADGADLCRYLNETIAAMVERAPGRFFGLGAVPLQDVDLAIEVLDEAVHRFHLRGVEIAGHVNGTPIGAPQFHPFFEAAQRWSASIFVHPLRAGTDKLVGPPILEQVLAFPGEIGLAGASLLTGGVLSRFPALRIALSHGAGSLPVQLARLEHAWHKFPMLRDTLSESPSALARRLYVDDLVYSPDFIAQLVRSFGEDRVMVGTDYPFPIMDDDPAARTGAGTITPEAAQLLRRENAMRWLGIGPAD